MTRSLAQAENERKRSADQWPPGGAKEGSCGREVIRELEEALNSGN